MNTDGTTWDIEVKDSNLIAIADGTNGLMLFEQVPNAVANEIWQWMQ
jgi:hypothetical protein